MLTVTVTEDDIERGIQGSGFNCPIALALQRTTGNHEMFVGRADVHNAREHETKYALSGAARRFIQKFDLNRRSVRPSTFRLKEMQ